MSVIARVRTARKPHECIACRGAIPAGRQYREWRVTPGDAENGNGRWVTDRLHMPRQCQPEHPPAGVAGDDE